MAVKIRLQRKGRKKAPFYHIVVADSRSPRDGKFIKKIGTYNPMTSPAIINLDTEAAYEWLEKGAQATDTVRAILGFKGVLYKKHLMRGVRKGALSLEEAEAKHQSWLTAKVEKIAKRIESKKEEISRFHQMVSGTAKPKKVEEPVVEETTATTDDQVVEDQVAETPAADETPAVDETPTAEETPAAESASEESTDAAE